MAEFGDDFGRGPRRPSFAPTTPRRPSGAPTAPAPGAHRQGQPDSDAPPSSTFDGEDFLFHLYRGSELLQDNCVSEAKEELELALKVQPQDIEGQGLLGVVYFRLGLYPRAIEIYEVIIRICPDEITPRVNLALCFLKTGQSQPAREVLEAVTTRVPGHVRAWGYLGLVYERQGDVEKARTAFERAGQPHLARRMQLLLDDEQTEHRHESEPPPERALVRAAAADAIQELETDELGFSRAHADADLAGAAVRSGLWRASEPGEEAMPPAPRSRRASLAGRLGPAVPAISESGEPAELGRAAVVQSPSVSFVAPASRAGQPVVSESRRTALVAVSDKWAARADAIRGLLADGASFTHAAMKRHVRGRELTEPLGGPASPWLLLSGHGELILGAAPELEFCALELSGSFVYVRESCLVAFAGTARHENGRLPTGGGEPIPMVQVSGNGTVLLESRKPPRVLEIAANQTLAVRAEDVVGWIGRLLGHPLDHELAPLNAPGFVSFSGTGSVLVDLG